MNTIDLPINQTAPFASSMDAEEEGCGGSCEGYNHAYQVVYWGAGGENNWYAKHTDLVHFTNGCPRNGFGSVNSHVQSYGVADGDPWGGYDQANCIGINYAGGFYFAIPPLCDTLFGDVEYNAIQINGEDHVDFWFLGSDFGLGTVGDACAASVGFNADNGSGYPPSLRAGTSEAVKQAEFNLVASLPVDTKIATDPLGRKYYKVAIGPPPIRRP